MRILPAIIGLAVAFSEEQPVPTRSIVDVLSSNAEFSDLVRLLQHHELIPFINQIWNSTLLAPVNSAFVGLDKDTITRDQLLYHLVNATVYSDDISAKTVVYPTYLDDGKAPISLSLDKGVNNEVEFDEMDLLASPQRGLVHALPKLLKIPDTLTKQLYLDSDLSTFAALADDEAIFDYATVLVPKTNELKHDLAVHAGINSSRPLLDYLNSAYGERDRSKVVQRHISSHMPFGREYPLKIEVLDGKKATLYANSTIKFDGTDISYESAINVARNGVYLKISGLLASPDESLFSVTAEKIILGIGGYDFVKAATLYDLRDLITQPSSSDRPDSIVVPTMDSRRSQRDPHAMADPKNLYLYHFLDSVIPKNEKSALLDSKMTLRSGKYPQRIHFERGKYGSAALNWEIIGSDIYQWGNTTFYTCSELLTLPPSLLMSLGPLLVSSYSIGFLDKLNRLQLPLNDGWTVFVPTRDAWEKNSLLRKYLDTNDDSLARVFDNLIYQTPIYSDTGAVETEQYRGKPALVDWEPEYRQFCIENQEVSTALSVEVTDALFDNGVAHIVNDIPLPSNLEITAEDLIDAGERSLFIDLLKAADMEDVLDPSSNLTMLVPPPKDLKKHNYTKTTNVKTLQNMLKLHLIPDVSLSKLFDGETATTLAGEELEIHALDPAEKFFSLSPESASNGQRVLILEYGYTNGEVASGSGVIFIDRHIAPNWIVPIRFGLRKGTYAVMGIIIGLMVALAIVFSMLLCCAKPSDQFDVIDEEPQYRDVEEDGEDSSSTQPIAAPAVSEDRAHGRHLNLPN